MEDRNEGEIELTILMPCLNEAEMIGICIDKAFSYLARSGIRGEVLVADNDSTDDSRAISAKKMRGSCWSSSAAAVQHCAPALLRRAGATSS